MISLMAKSLLKRQKSETWSMNFEVDGSLLEGYDTNDVISEADADIMKTTPLHNKTQIEYAELFWAKGLHLHHAYNEYIHKGGFIRILQNSIRQSIHSFGGSNKHSTV